MNGRRSHRVVADELRDTEIDHARLIRSVSPCRRAHQDVARLEIAVKNPLPMRVTDRARDKRKHAHARFKVVSMAVTPSVKRNSVDILHHEVRRTLGRCPRIKDVRDVRMFEPCERDLLRLKSPSRLSAQ